MSPRYLWTRLVLFFRVWRLKRSPRKLARDYKTGLKMFSGAHQELRHMEIRASTSILEMLSEEEREEWHRLRSSGRELEADKYAYRCVRQRVKSQAEDAREIAAGLCEYEIEVLRGDHDGQWGAAIGAAIDVLRSRGLYGTPLGRAVARAAETSRNDE